MPGELAMPKKTLFRLMVCLLTTGVLGCVPRTATEATPTFIVSLPSHTPTFTRSSPTETQASSIHYQLTYVMPYLNDRIQCPAVYARDVGCLEENEPCIGEPILLFWIPLTLGTEASQEYFARDHIHDVSWSPDGQEIAFIANGVNNEFDLFISRWNGENMRNITQSSLLQELSVSWSSGGQLLYTAKSIETLEEHAYVMDSSMTTITELPLGDRVHSAMWVPDSTDILFASLDINNFLQLFLSNERGDYIRQLTYSTGDNIRPDFTTDGLTVFFSWHDFDANADNIYRINIDGTNENVFLENSPGVDSWYLSLAPYENWLAFSKGGLSMDIFLMELNDNEVVIPITFVSVKFFL